MGGRSEVDVVIVGAGFAGLYMLHRLARLGLDRPGLRGRRRRRRHLVLEPLPRRPLRRREHGVLLRASPRSSSRSGSGASATPPSPRSSRYARPRRRPLRPAARHPVRHPGRRRRHFDEADAPLDGRAPTDGDDGCRPGSCVMATGCLSSANIPTSTARDTFAGPTFHTGRWPHEGVDFTGQRVGVIGTGSSAIQSIPLIAEQAADLTVFQRTPNYTRARPATGPSTRSEVAAIKADYAELPRANRQTLHRLRRRASPPERPSALEVDRRGARGASSSTAGSEAASRSSAPSTTCSSTGTPTTPPPSSCASKIRDIVEDPEVGRALAPETRSIGCKRLCVDTGYYATFNRHNVRPRRPARRRRSRRITPDGHPHGRAATYELDAIVYATGFDAMTGALAGSTSAAATASRSRRVGGRARAPTSAWRRRASRTCSPSPARAAPRCSPT